jgi:hypothetical protein
MKTNKLFYSLILAAVCALALSGCFITQGRSAGLINGKPVPYDAYMESYRAHYNNFQILNNRVPDTDEIRQIKRETWRDATKGQILKTYFEKYNISVTPQEVLDTLMNSVPEYILNSPNFQYDGQFDRLIYLKSLQSDTPEDLRLLRQQYYEFVIPIFKLKRYLIEDELFTPAEQKLCARIMQTRADIDWVILDFQDFNPTVSEDEINLYYRDHADEFRLQPHFSAVYTKFPVTPSKDDIALSVAVADTLYHELTAGKSAEDAILARAASFPQLLWKNSGFLKIESLDPQSYALLASLEEGSYSKPYPDADGITIYQLVQRTKSMCDFNTLRVPYVPSSESIDKETTKVVRFVQLAQTIGLRLAADEMSLSFSATGDISPDVQWLDDSRAQRSLQNQMLADPARTILEPVYSESNRAWIAVAVEDNELLSVKSLENVRDQIREKLAAVKQKELALEMGNNILAGETTPPPVAKTINLKAMQVSSDFMGEPASQIFYRVMRNHYLEEPRKANIMGNSVCLPFVRSYTVDKGIQVSPEQMKKLFLADLSDNWFDTWMERQVKKARVQIFVQ